MEPVDGLGDLDLRLGAEEIRHVQQRARLLIERIGDGRVGVAQRRHCQPCQEIEVAVAVAVVQFAAAAAHELDRRRSVGGHEWAVLQRCGAHGDGMGVEPVGGACRCRGLCHEFVTLLWVSP